MSVVFFSVSAKMVAVLADASGDSDYNPDLRSFSADVTFTPLIKQGDVVKVYDLNPPTMFVPVPITAFVDTNDGLLKLRTTPDSGGTGTYAPLRLLGNSSSLDLQGGSLYYSFAFSNIRIDGRPTTTTITGGAFQAPTFDTTIDLIDYMRATGQTATGVNRIAPGAVRLDNGNIVFSFGNVDIPNSIPFSPVFTTSEITDSGALGRNVVKANDVNDLWDTVGQVPANYLPSYVDDVLEFDNQAGFPATGETGKIYIAKDTGDSFRWTGSAYLRISDRITAAGITDSTAVGRALVTATDAVSARAAISPSATDFLGTVTSVKTGAYTAAIGDIVLCDAVLNGFTVTLPEAPPDKSRVTVKKIDSSTNTVLVQRSGADVFNQAGGLSALQLFLPSQTVRLQYSSGVWTVIDHSYGPSALTSITTPRKVWNLLDGNGNQMIEFYPADSAVTWLQIANSINSFSYVELAARSSGSNALTDIRLTPRGTSGAVTVYNTGGFSQIRADGPDSTAELYLKTKGIGGVYLGISDTNVNYLYTRGTSSGNGLSLGARLFASGSDTNINLNLVSKGTGTVQANGVTVVDVSTSQTITGKTMSGASNTFSAIPQSAVTSLTTDLAAKEPTITAGTTGQYWRGDKTWQTLDKTAVGLSNVENTADSSKVVASAAKLTTARTINGVSFDGTANITVADSTKEPAITAGTTGQYWRGDKTWQTLDKTAVGLGSVDNTADSAKIVASAAKLTTARTINGVSFDGTANITVTAAPTVTKVTGPESTTLGSTAGQQYIYLLGSGAVPTLPTAVGNTSIYHLKCTHTAAISVALAATTPAQTIDGAAGPLSVGPNQCYTLVSDGLNWVII